MTSAQQEETKSLKVLVTGGAGFIGSHLCRRLLDEGHEVIAVDNFMTGSRENVEELLPNMRFQLIERDVVRGLLDVVRRPIDRIYNLACPASPRHYQRDPVHTTLTNVVGAYSCLRLAERWGARCLLASTSEVYGDPDVHPQREDYRGNVSSIGPRACYDEGKRCAESLMMDYRRTRSLPVRVARIFNTYGPRMALDDGRVISNFIVQALRGEALTVYGDGSQTRSLCYVDDLVDGLIGLMERSPVPGPLNLGNPEEYSVLEIAERVIAQIGKGRIVRRPLPEDDPRRRRPDISAAQRAFGFKPRVSFEEGLKATIAYFEAKVRTQQALLSTG
jgi:UDP-glucuronate decarboxylase